MTKDNLVFATCGLLLGLVIGSLIIGPKVAQSKLASGAPTAAAASPEVAPAAAAGGEAGNPMEQVRRQIETLKQAVAADPRNFEALVQLGNMYMDAAKYPQAIDYYERALAVREDAGVRTDLGGCYQRQGDLDKALAAFRKVIAEAPDLFAARLDEAMVLAQMQKTDEAKAKVAELKKLKPNDPDVARLEQLIEQGGAHP